jgi:hypothetical protein
MTIENMLEVHATLGRKNSFSRLKDNFKIIVVGASR